MINSIDWMSFISHVRSLKSANGRRIISMRNTATKVLCIASFAFLLLFSRAYAQAQANDTIAGQHPAPSSSAAEHAFLSKLLGTPHVSQTTPPFRGDTLWQKIMALVQLHGGFIKPDELGATFDAKLVRTKSFGNSGYAADVVGGGEWLKDVHYQEYFKRYVNHGEIINSEGRHLSLVFINWPSDMADQKNCINPVSSADQLRKLGWHFNAPRMESPAEFAITNDFSLLNSENQSRIFLIYGNSSGPNSPINPESSCVNFILIQGRL